MFSIAGSMVEVGTWEAVFCKKNILNIVSHATQEHLVAQWGVNSMCVASWNECCMGIFSIGVSFHEHKVSN